MGKIEENILKIRENIASALLKTKREQAVEIVCVTKGRQVPDIITAINTGIGIIGENRVQEALEKKELVGRMAKWHMIGHLQTNKVRSAIEIFDVIQSVDSIYLLNEINHYAGRQGKVQEVYVEIKVSPEESKFGLPVEQAAGFFEDVKTRETELKHIVITGMMAMAPVLGDPEEALPYFVKARELFDVMRGEDCGRLVRLQNISMGMSSDYIQAVEAGASLVRIGSKIFD